MLGQQLPRGITVPGEGGTRHVTVASSRPPPRPAAQISGPGHPCCGRVGTAQLGSRRLGGVAFLLPKRTPPLCKIGHYYSSSLGKKCANAVRQNVHRSPGRKRTWLGLVDCSCSLSTQASAGVVRLVQGRLPGEAQVQRCCCGCCCAAGT